MAQKLANFCHPLVVVILLWMTCLGPDFLTRAQHSNKCAPGWFGPRCKFQCYCLQKVPCDNITGECPSDVPCEPGSFGPKCQYFDLVKELKVTGTPPYLMDRDNTTCNPDPKAKQLTVSLNQSMIFLWFRVLTDIDMSNHDMFVELDNENCYGRRVYRVSDQILDVSCSDVRRPHKDLHIHGPVVGHICELYISGGRNVALKQQASQPHSLRNVYMDLTSAYNAVDGNRNRRFEDGSCTATDTRQGIPWWALEYDRPQLLFRIIIIGRVAHAQRLNGFTLEVYGQDKSGTPLYIYNNTDNVLGVIYSYELQLPVLSQYVSRIKIWIKENSNLPDNILTLCEVETYGETICDKGYHGINCDEPCKCGTNEDCSLVTGVCSNPCETQDKDINCTYPCQPNCLNTECRNATCISCVDGYEGPYCDEVVSSCPQGKFGKGCNQSCSANCQGSTCDAKNGHCVACVGAQVMPFCEKDEKDAEQQKDKEEGFNLLYLLLLLLLLPLAILLFCCFRRKKSPPPLAETEPAPKPKPTQEEPPLAPEEIFVTGSSVDIAGSETHIDPGTGQDAQIL